MLIGIPNWAKRLLAQMLGFAPVEPLGNTRLDVRLGRNVGPRQETLEFTTSDSHIISRFALSANTMRVHFNNIIQHAGEAEHAQKAISSTKECFQNTTTLLRHIPTTMRDSMFYTKIQKMSGMPLQPAPLRESDVKCIAYNLLSAQHEANYLSNHDSFTFYQAVVHYFTSRGESDRQLSAFEQQLNAERQQQQNVIDQAVNQYIQRSGATFIYTFTMAMLLHYFLPPLRPLLRRHEVEEQHLWLGLVGFRMLLQFALGASLQEMTAIYLAFNMPQQPQTFLLDAFAALTLTLSGNKLGWTGAINTLILPTISFIFAVTLANLLISVLPPLPVIEAEPPAAPGLR